MSQQNKLMGVGQSAASAAQIVGDVATGLTAAGTGQSTALALSCACNYVETVASGTGVRLYGMTGRPSSIGDEQAVYNAGANTLSVYPPSGEQIVGAAQDAAFSVPAGVAVTFKKVKNTLWLVVSGDAAFERFIQSGTGAVSEPVQTVMRRIQYDVKSYGAVGNNSTDDTTAIQSAITAASAGGIVYFPPGTYKITGALNVTNGMRFVGAGRAKSIIAGYSTTAHGFQVSTSDSVSFERLQFTRTGTVPSSGAAILFTHGTTENIGSDVVDCIFSNWFRGCHFERAQQWRVSKCYFANCYEMGIYAQNVYNGDSGANVIDGGTIFDNSLGGTTYAVYYGSGGGLTLQGVKFLSHTYQFYQNLESAVSTGINVINSCSFEGSATEAIHFGNANANGAFTHVIVTDNEISGPTTGILTTGGSDYLANLVLARNSISVASGGTCISLSRGRNITVNHNIYVGNGGSPTALVAGANVSNLTYGQGDVFSGITTKYNIAGSTNAGMLTGSGVPSGSDGANGDFYFRTDGTVAGSTVVYHKQGGVWVALTTT